MKLTDSILLWSAVSAAVFLALSGILELLNLRFRTWIREPVTILIALGGAGGLLQLVLLIPLRWLRILVTVLWGIAAVVGLIAGVWVFAFEHLHEQSHAFRGKPYVCDGRRCIAERSESVSGYRYDYYEPRFLLFRSTIPRRLKRDD